MSALIRAAVGVFSRARPFITRNLFRRAALRQNVFRRVATGVRRPPAYRYRSVPKSQIRVRLHTGKIAGFHRSLAPNFAVNALQTNPERFDIVNEGQRNIKRLPLRRLQTAYSKNMGDASFNLSKAETPAEKFRAGVAYNRFLEPHNRSYEPFWDSSNLPKAPRDTSLPQSRMRLAVNDFARRVRSGLQGVPASLRERALAFERLKTVPQRAGTALRSIYNRIRAWFARRGTVSREEFLNGGERMQRRYLNQMRRGERLRMRDFRDRMELNNQRVREFQKLLAENGYNSVFPEPIFRPGRAVTAETSFSVRPERGAAKPTGVVKRGRVKRKAPPPPTASTSTTAPASATPVYGRYGPVPASTGARSKIPVLKSTNVSKAYKASAVEPSPSTTAANSAREKKKPILKRAARKISKRSKEAVTKIRKGAGNFGKTLAKAYAYTAVGSPKRGQ